MTAAHIWKLDCHLPACNRYVYFLAITGTSDQFDSFRQLRSKDPSDCVFSDLYQWVAFHCFSLVEFLKASPLHEGQP